MFSYVIFLFIGLSCALNPTCDKCKWFIPNKNGVYEYGFCKMFANYYYTKDEKFILNEYARYSRKNENQCGPPGYLFEPKNTHNFIYKNDLLNMNNIKDEINHLQEKLTELEEQISGEVNEKKDLEEIEREYNSILKKIAALRRSNIKKNHIINNNNHRNLYDFHNNNYPKM